MKLESLDVLTVAQVETRANELFAHGLAWHPDE